MITVSNLGIQFGKRINQSYIGVGGLQSARLRSLLD